jgi:hypothetical protein
LLVGQRCSAYDPRVADQASEAGGIGFKLLVGSEIAGGMVACGLLILRWTDPGPWRLFIADQGVADLLTATIGSVIGAGLAVLVAYSVLRAQVVADQKLARETRTAEVIHDVAGELAVWVSGLTNPSDSSQRGRLPSDGPRPVLRALTSRRDLLEHNGIGSLDALSEAVRQLERDRESLVRCEASIKKRAPKRPKVLLADHLRLGLALAVEINTEWSKISAELDRIAAYARELAGWKAGEKVAPFEFEPGKRVAEMSVVEERLHKKGFVIPRDKNLEALGYYTDWMTFPDAPPEGTSTETS